jgi:uncharacterized phage protein gp47/JayE
MPLPDYLEPQEETAVLDRMRARISADIDTSEGSFLWDALMPAALELALADDRLRTVFELGFVQTTFGEFLDQRAEEHGVARRQAVAATGQVTFTGTDGTLILAGTTVVSPGSDAVMPQEVATDADATIAGGTATVAATATTAGAAGNLAVGAIQIVDPPVAGVDSVTNAVAFTGGLEEEDDDSLRTRLLTFVRNPGTSGNQADYTNWALEVPGVGGVSVVPLEDGPGTVTVAIIGTDYLPASAGVVAEVQEYIAPGGSNAGTGKAPIGAAVTVEAASAVTINVAADLTIESGYDTGDVETAARASIQSYIDSIAFATDNDVRHARVVTAILDTPGIVDATSVTLNGGSANIPLGAKDVATLGTTTWS